MVVVVVWCLTLLTLLVVVALLKVARVVPQQSAFVIENLGKYSRTLHAGFHILVPFMERIAYRHSLKELAADIAEQTCITRDNVQVGVDGVCEGVRARGCEGIRGEVVGVCGCCSSPRLADSRTLAPT